MRNMTETMTDRTYPKSRSFSLCLSFYLKEYGERAIERHRKTIIM